MAPRQCHVAVASHELDAHLGRCCTPLLDLSRWQKERCLCCACHLRLVTVLASSTQRICVSCGTREFVWMQQELVWRPCHSNPINSSEQGMLPGSVSSPVCLRCRALMQHSDVSRGGAASTIRSMPAMLTAQLCCYPQMLLTRPLCSGRTGQHWPDAASSCPDKVWQA